MNTIKRRSLPILAATLVILVPSFAQAATDNFLVSGLKEILWTLVNVVFGWMVWAGGLLLNFAVETYVVGFGRVFEESGLGYSINTLWAIVRDIFNLTFIFGLVYIGFKMIFNSGDSNAKRMLGSLILAALLVNFSLFITKFIIDFANIAATQFAQAFAAGSTGNYAVADSFMNLFGITGLWNTGGAGLSSYAGGAGFAYIFGTLFLYLIAAFVFAAGGLLLIIRFVVLNIYMILSPLMFLGFVFPGLKSVSNQYWEGFLGRAFFAPAYLLMLYFANQVLVNMQGVATAGSRNLAGAFASDNTSAAAANAAQSFESTIVFFIITAVFLISALVVAQKMGAVGASNAVAMGKRFSTTARKYTQQKVGGATFGAAAVAGQRTIGYGANRLADNNKLQGWAAKSKIGRAALGASRKVADSSFDARQVMGVGATMGIGTGKKGGYDTRVKEQSDADAKFAKSLSETKVKNSDGTYVNDDIKTRVRSDVERQKTDETTAYAKALKNKAETDRVATATEAALLAGQQKATTDQQALRTKIQDLETEKTKTILQPEIDRLNNEIEESKRSIIASETAVKKLKTDADKAKTDADKAKTVETQAEKDAKASAESRITYEKQLAFIASKEKDSKSIITGAPSAVTAMAAGVMGFGGLGLVTGVPVSRSFRNQNQESVDNLKKMYGEDGRALTKSKKQKESMRILAEQIKESGELPTAEAAKE
jgi:hypothetical protein